MWYLARRCFVPTAVLHRSKPPQPKNKTGYGYRLRNRATISHLLCMDDIKLYAKNEQHIDSMTHITRIYNTDILIGCNSRL